MTELQAEKVLKRLFKLHCGLNVIKITSISADHDEMCVNVRLKGTRKDRVIEFIPNSGTFKWIHRFGNTCADCMEIMLDAAMHSDVVYPDYPSYVVFLPMNVVAEQLLMDAELDIMS